MHTNKYPGAVVSTGARAKTRASSPNIESVPLAQAPSPVFVLRVQFVRGGSEVARLRAILKTLLRHWGLRCISIEPEAQHE